MTGRSDPMTLGAWMSPWRQSRTGLDTATRCFSSCRAQLHSGGIGEAALRSRRRQAQAAIQRVESTTTPVIQRPTIQGSSCDTDSMMAGRDALRVEGPSAVSDTAAPAGDSAQPAATKCDAGEDKVTKVTTGNASITRRNRQLTP